MEEPGRRHAAAAWWRGLSGGWRANVGLYCLATLALVALVAQIMTGGGQPAQRVEVASRAPVSTAPTSRPQITTTAPPTTVAGPATTEAPTTTAAPGPAAPNTPASPTPLAVGPSAPENTTVPPPVCRNSTNPDCGAFYWDPPPAPNQQLNVAVTASAPNANGDVAFSVRVTDPDHRITNNCAQANYGDGVVDSLPCTFPPCFDAHGPWDPPPQINGDATFIFRHQYRQAGTYTPSFTFHTDLDLPCPSPYGSAGSGQTTIMVP